MSILGKRAREASSRQADQDGNVSSDDDAKARELFQRAFEAKFKPLARQQAPPSKDNKRSHATQAETEKSYEDDGWDGLSESSETAVEIVQVRDAYASDKQATQPQDVRAFISSKLPTSVRHAATHSQKTKKQATDVDKDEAVNLQNDVALQRLLKESHLLDAANYGGTGTEVQGKSRLKALDLRIQDLGGKDSHLEQKKMPLSHRRGIADKATNREQRRRKEAAENGIILEVAKSSSARSIKPRDVGLGGPSVGRFKGGMLKLSNNDLKGIRRVESGDRGRRKRPGR